MSGKMFFHCEKCGKRLIEKLPGGLWRFVFGRSHRDEDVPISEKFPMVEMLVHGSIKMRCFRRACRLEYPDHWNTFNFFPVNLPPKIQSKEEDYSGTNEKKGGE